MERGCASKDLSEDPIPFQPWAAEKRNAMTRVELELEQRLTSIACRSGTPGMFTENAFAHQIMMKPGLLCT